MLFQPQMIGARWQPAALCLAIASLLWMPAFAQSNVSDGAASEAAKPNNQQGDQSRWEANHERVKQAFVEAVEFEFFETPLNDVIEFIAERSDFNFTFDENALDELGLDTSQLVTQSVKNVALRTAMELILRPIELTYVIRDGVVVITTEEKAQQLLITKHYPVRDLLHADFPAKSMDQLIRVVTTTIAPESWEETGGPATICSYQGILIARQTDRAHDELAQLIEELRGSISATGGPSLPLADKGVRPHGYGGRSEFEGSR
jgi:hypothetical protein